MDRFCMLLLLGLVAVVPALGATSCEAGGHGGCPARDSEDPLAEEVEAQTVNLLQGRMKVQEQQQEASGDNAEEGAYLASLEIADEDVDADEDEQEMEVVQVKDTCDPCDTACLTKSNTASFVQCDADKDSKLTLKELQYCMRHWNKRVEETDSSVHYSNLALGELVTDAAQFFTEHDENKDSELSEDEFANSMPVCEASLKEEGTVISSRSLGVSKCLGSTITKVTKKVGSTCTRDKSVQHCSLAQTDAQGRRRRKGGGIVKVVRKAAKKTVQAVAKVIKCVWSTVKEAYSCVKDVVMDVVSNFASSFGDCWNELKKDIGGKTNGAFMSLIPSCSNVNDCKNKLLAGPEALVNKVLDFAKEKAFSVMESGPLKDGVDFVIGATTKLPAVATALGTALGSMATAVVKMAKGTAKSIAGNYNALGDLCTSNRMWSYEFTDCGAFSRMADIFNPSNVNNIPGIFADVVAKFATCLIKLGMLSLPSPFMDIKLGKWCVPDFLQVPIKGIVATFQYVISQIAAVGSGCSGSNANEPVCQMALDMKDIGVKLAEALSSAFLQKTAIQNAIGNKAGGCGDDFTIFIAGKAVFGFPPGCYGCCCTQGDLAIFGLTFKNGCLNGQYYADLYFGVQAYKFILGITLNQFPKPHTQLGILVDLGFDLGTPSKDIVQWKGQFLLVGSLKVTCAKVKLVLGFKVLPDPAWPAGFTASVVAKVMWDGNLAQQSIKAKEQELEAAVEEAEQPEAKIWAGMERIVFGLKHLPPTALEPLMAQLAATQQGREAGMLTSRGMQNTSTVQNTSACDPKTCCCPPASFGIIVPTPVGPISICPEELGLYAGLALDICLTCSFTQQQKNAAGASEDASGAADSASAVASSASADASATGWSVTNGLVLDFRGNKGTSSSKWENQVSGGPDAEVPSGVSYSSTDSAYHMPGRGQVITVNLKTNPAEMSHVTYSAWVKLLNNHGTKGWLLSQFPDYGWSRSVTINDGRLGGVGVTPGSWNSGLGSAPSGQWMHIAGTWTGYGGTCYAYKNGQRSGAHSCRNGQRSNNGGERFVIGGRQANDGGHNSEVLVSDVAVFNRALSASEITQLYNAGRPSTSSGAAVVASTGWSVTSGLVLDYRGNVGASSSQWLNQVSGGPAASVGSGVSYNSGEKAYQFPGRGQVLLVNLKTNPAEMPAVTYSAWVKLLNTQGTKGWLLSQTPDYGWSRSLTISDGRLGGIGVTPGSWNSGLGSAPTGQWMHIAGTWTSYGGTCYAYKNGQRSGAHSCRNGQRGGNGGERFVIGGRQVNDGGHNAQVLISDVALYNRALSPGEISSLASSGRPSQAR